MAKPQRHLTDLPHLSPKQGKTPELPAGMHAQSLLKCIEYHQQLLLSDDKHEKRQATIALCYYQAIINRMRAIRGNDQDVKTTFPPTYASVAPPELREEARRYIQELRTRPAGTAKNRDN